MHNAARVLVISFLLLRPVAALASTSNQIPVYILKAISTDYVPVSSFVATTLRLSAIEDYGPYLVAWVPSEDTGTFVERAASMGLMGRLAPDYQEIRFRDYVIAGSDIQAPGLPSDLTLTDYTGPLGLYVVQFQSPVREEWLTALRDGGARSIHYLPENSYLVACSPRAWSALAGIKGVRHTIVYQPAYKLATELLTSDASRRVLIQLDQEQSWTSVLNTVEKLSTEPISYSLLGPYLNLEATLTLPDIKALASESTVIWIESVPETSPSDERASQILAGNHGASQATLPGTYKTTFLQGVCSGCLLDTTMQTYVINVMDTGLDRGSTSAVHADLTGRIHSWKDYWCPACTTTYGESRPSHGELVAGLIAGDPPPGTGGLLRDDLNFYWGSGVAPRSKLRISRIFGPFFENITGFGPGTVTTVTKDAYVAGARFQNQSWNTGSGTTPPTVAYDGFAQAVDFLVRDAYGGSPWTTIRPMFISVAAGNYPYLIPNSLCPTCVASPANAKNAVAVGATAEERLGGTCNSTSRPL